MADRLGDYSPSTKWAHGGPLIEEHEIIVCPDGSSWLADCPGAVGLGTTPLQAICRAVVRAAFGDEVEEVTQC